MSEGYTPSRDIDEEPVLDELKQVAHVLDGMMPSFGRWWGRANTDGATLLDGNGEYSTPALLLYGELHRLLVQVWYPQSAELLATLSVDAGDGMWRVLGVVRPGVLYRPEVRADKMKVELRADPTVVVQGVAVLY